MPLSPVREDLLAAERELKDHVERIAELRRALVFTRDESGPVLHYYTTEGSLVESHHRMMGLYSPVWNLFDLLPGGRGDWMSRHFYHD